MFYREHGPAHFHAEYQGQHAKFGLNGKVDRGTLRSYRGLPWLMNRRDAPRAAHNYLRRSSTTR